MDSSIVLAQRLSDRPSGWQTTVRPLQGVPHEMACYHATFTAPDGVPAGTIGVLVDMTEHTQALQAERAGRACAEAALDTVADGVITIDAQGLVRTINGAAQRVIGLAQGQTVGRHVDKVFRLEPPHSALPAAAAQGHAAHGAGAAATAILACHSGAPRTVDYSVAAVHAPDGTAAGHVLVFRPR
ncbi:PAS domain-containing protein [Diaphorobacter sp.]|uniref:PAS domain-containing protein n=1 Tax=Diaphorobacter sp. TaxID=1934310 RepID=UPI00258FFB43|nr:PAS domain-containing protein [Diaphorobacter sp.]